MAKKVFREVKLQIEANKATPAPPVGTALGPLGINIMEFCKQFNEQSASSPGMIIPVLMSIYEDKTFTFVLKTPPAAVLILKALGLEKGSGVPNQNIVGELTDAQLEEIAKKKMEDLNAYDVKSAKKMIGGTARSMGVKIAEG